MVLKTGAMSSTGPCPRERSLQLEEVNRMQEMHSISVKTRLQERHQPPLPQVLDARRQT